MRKLIFLLIASVVHFAHAQEARMMIINVNPYEIEGYGVIEGEIKQIHNSGAPHPGRLDSDRPVNYRPRTTSTLRMTYTTAETKESRSYSCDDSHVDYLIKTLGKFQSLAEDSTSVALPRTGIEKKTLNPAVVLSDEGVESTYTEEYTYEGFADVYTGNQFIIGVYTNGKGQAVYYYQIGEAPTLELRNTWRILTNECDTFIEWLTTTRKAM